MSERKRRQFSSEFKLEAVRQITPRQSAVSAANASSGWRPGRWGLHPFSALTRFSPYRNTTVESRSRVSLLGRAPIACHCRRTRSQSSSSSGEVD